jgi:hypothetical protein
MPNAAKDATLAAFDLARGRLREMTNYEAPMTDEVRMTNDELSHGRLRGAIRHSGLVLLSSLGVSSFVILALAVADEPALKQIGTITHPPIREASGLVASRTQRGVFWTINDSGNLPHLFAIDRTGKLLAEFRVRGAVNIDWESLALDDKGHLYIGDVGNNSTRLFPNGLPVRSVIRLREPSLKAAGRASNGAMAEVTADQIYYYGFPDKPFDVEGMFERDGAIYLFSKVRKSPAALYRLTLDRPGETTKLAEVCKLPGLTLITGADISPDGRRLAICSYTYALCVELTAGQGLEELPKLERRLVRYNSDDIESCAWDRDDLILVGEGRQVYSLPF